MRVNKPTPAHMHVAQRTDKATGDSKRLYGGKANGSYASPRPPGCTPPPTHSTLQDRDNYVPGMGDTFCQPQRPGSDHSNILSRGYV